MELHLPVLQVIIPLIAAPLCVMCKNSYVAWGIALVGTWSAFAVTIILVLYSVSGEMRYAMGDWLPPIGIEYRIDIFSSFILMVVTGIASVMLPYAARSVDGEIEKEKQPNFYCVFMLCLAGLLGIVTTNDVFNIYVFLEISSLSTYALIAMGKDRRALTSSFEYLILGTIGATFFLIGIGLLYMVTGTLNITDLAERIKTVGDMRPIQAAFAFLTVGLALKIAMFPLHLWLTNAYAFAPSFISAFLSASATKVSIYVLLRLVFTLFGLQFSFNEMPLGTVLLTLGFLGVIVGSFTAIFQANIKRMLAFSSVAQVGYIVLGIGLATTTGLTASIVHLLNHALAKGALFLAIGCICFKADSVRIENIRGIAKKMPWTMAAFVIAGLSLIGIPGTAGFISKWYFIKAFIDQQMWILVATILLSSLLAVIYIWRVVEAAYFQAPPDNISYRNDSSKRMLAATWVLSLSSIYFGFDTGLSLGLAKDAAKILMAGGG